MLGRKCKRVAAAVCLALALLHFLCGGLVAEQVAKLQVQVVPVHGLILGPVHEGMVCVFCGIHQCSGVLAVVPVSVHLAQRVGDSLQHLLL